jgi:5,5'-dehydrodivanillate O-demethylase oxygenase subunit
MLSAEKNERLTPVGPGTPMGELLRRSRLVGEDMLV